MSAELLTEYDATLDKKRRFVVRGLPPFSHFHVSVYKKNRGKKSTYTLKMEPRVLASLDQLSVNTLRMLDSSMNNFSKGKVSEHVDLEKVRKIADAL